MRFLGELEANDKPRVTALNKTDLLADPDELDVSLYPNAVPISALHKNGLDTLLEKISAVLASSMVAVQVLLPFSKGDLVELFHRRGYVASEQHTAEGTFIVGRIPQALRGYYIPYARTLHR